MKLPRSVSSRAAALCCVVTLALLATATATEKNYTKPAISQTPGNVRCGVFRARFPDLRNFTIR
jgi:hypothetical protein